MKNCKNYIILFLFAFLGVNATAFAQGLYVPPVEKVNYVGPYSPEVMKEMNGEPSELQLKIEKLMNYSTKFIGRPYRSGSKGPNAFDCSGFTSYVFKNVGIKLNASSSSQYTQGIPVAREELKSGDLVFFKGSRSKGVGHVGIVYSADHENNEYKFIHASNRRGIVIENLDADYFGRRYVGARRILEDKKEM